MSNCDLPSVDANFTLEYKKMNIKPLNFLPFKSSDPNKEFMFSSTPFTLLSS